MHFVIITITKIIPISYCYSKYLTLHIQLSPLGYESCVRKPGTRTSGNHKRPGQDKHLYKQQT